MRNDKAQMTQAQVAEAVGRELGRRISPSQVPRWESGAKLPGADVYRAYIIVSGAGLPTTLGGYDPRAAPSQRLLSIEQRIARAERLLDLPASGDEPGPADLVSTDEAAQAVGRTRQTIHNWIKAKRIRAYPHGRWVRVSRSEVIGEAARLDRLLNRS